MIDAGDISEPAGDPFERFNRQQGVGVVDDPHTRWAALRGRAPLVRQSYRELFGRDVPSLPGMSPDLYLVLSFDAVVDVLRDGDTFSSSAYGPTMGLVMGRTILEMDEPEHGRYRSLLSRAFSRRAIRRWERELVRPIVRESVARLRARGEGDLVHELTFPFPVRVIAGMIGIPPEQQALFHRLAVELISISFDPAAGMRASQELREMFARLLALRRREPREDLISVLAGADLAGERLADEAIYAFLRLLAPAGAETTYRSSSNLLCGLLRSPAQLDALRRDRGWIGAAIEEGLRWEPPLTSILRTARRAACVQGVDVPAGATLSVNLAAANRDPQRWRDPDRFDLFRPHLRHAAFAFGSHTCLGMQLARTETRVLLEELLDGLPGLRLAPGAEDTRVSGLMFRSPQALPVVCSA